ncbi:MAG: DUF1501 domain-containing protein [Verrucomicrobia bacterium]|nr:DUF1501 domain-containing protein [Verrucomicrobiota bacterium]
MQIISRRSFLKQSACTLLTTSAIMNTLFHLKGIGSALAANCGPIPDYKSLVCVFMRGGNDTHNLLTPISGPNRTHYDAGRGVLALPAGGLLALAPATYADGSAYGLNPVLSGIKPIFDAGHLAMVANVGTLVVPTTKALYTANAVPLPSQLFSHSDQQVQWQSSLPDQPFTTGWGGRMADLLVSANSALGAEISISMTLAGLNNFQVGVATAPYAVSTTGSVPLSGYGPAYTNALNSDGTYKSNNQGARLQAFRDLMAMGNPNLMQGAYASVVNRAYDADQLLTAALTSITVTTPFPASNLGAQLGMVAKLIAAREKLCQKRQIFFVVLDGFDTHDNQNGTHDALLIELNAALASFYDATVELGVQNQVTTFGASDFSRTLTPNKSDPTTAGSDHAWGTHMFVMGGAVNGGDIYGQIPSLLVNGPDDVNTSNGRGRYIPTTSVDEYAATLAKWFGVTGSNLDIVFPNLSRFPQPDLGFMA